MTDEEINKRIHEILGMCWHEAGEDKIDYALCKKGCGEKLNNNYTFTDSNHNRNFLTWEGYGILIVWWLKHKKFAEFSNPQNHTEAWYQGKHVPINLMLPRGLAEATVRFFKEENEKHQG